MNPIVERIERESGVPGLVSILAERLTPTDLQSILLAVYRLRINRLQPSEVLSTYQANRFVRPSAVSPTSLSEWEQVAFSNLPSEFEPLALSPVCPRGANSVVAPIDPNWSVATIRNSEVVSDSTNVLALECALRRQELLRSNPKSTASVHLAASHRLLRAQRYHDPKLVSHFSAFALCSAGRDRGSRGFEISALGLHIRFYLRAVRAFLGSSIPLHLFVTDFRSSSRRSLLDDQLLTPIRSEFDNVACDFDDARINGRGYYLDLCFHIHATTPAGRQLELVDGGSVDWTQQLLSDARERLIISGLGSERLCTEFKTP